MQLLHKDGMAQMQKHAGRKEVAPAPPTSSRHGDYICCV